MWIPPPPFHRKPTDLICKRMNWASSHHIMISTKSGQAKALCRFGSQEYFRVKNWAVMRYCELMLKLFMTAY